MNVTTLGIDIAKNVFQLHGIDAKDKVKLRRKLTRGKLMEFIQTLPPCLIGMEACGGANYWARKFKSMGHEVQLIAAQFVKPYVKSNKNDMHDAEAICEALTRPHMRFVAVKTIEQQDNQSLHRVRSLYVKQRTALSNQIRGLLTEYGIVLPKGVDKLQKRLPLIIEDGENELTFKSRELFSSLLEGFNEMQDKVQKYTLKINELCKSRESYRRLASLRGIGPITATAVYAHIGDAKVFKNGREMSAYLEACSTPAFIRREKCITRDKQTRGSLLKEFINSWSKIGVNQRR